MGVLVSKGFLVFAQNTDTVDYIKQAYALALSIKFSQQQCTNISLVTNDIVPTEYIDIFDSIIPIPWGDHSENPGYQAENRWKLYHATPYEETIVLDTDMLLLEDISVWWDYCSKYDLKYCSTITNYKLETVVDTIHRKAFIANKLTSPYSALHYFKKSPTALIFYKTLEFVCNNWEWCYTKFAPNEYQSWLSMDLAVAIAIEITGMHDEAIDTCCPLRFVHMKGPLQGWPMDTTSWQDNVFCFLNSKGDLIVGNIKQSKLFHYVEKDFLNQYIIDGLRRLVK